MWNPDLMLTKAAALRRQEAQRTGGDPYGRTVAMAVHHESRLAAQVGRFRINLGRRLVCWGRKLQRYGEPQTQLR